jgi:hypothetical protein
LKPCQCRQHLVAAYVPQLSRDEVARRHKKTAVGAEDDPEGGLAVLVELTDLPVGGVVLAAAPCEGEQRRHCRNKGNCPRLESQSRGQSGD